MVMICPVFNLIILSIPKYLSRVPSLVLQDHSPPPVLERHGRMESIARQLFEGRLVEGFINVEAHPDHAQAERDDPRSGWGLRRAAIDPAETVLHAQVVKETRRASGAVDERPDGHRQPLRLVLLASVIGLDRGA